MSKNESHHVRMLHAQNLPAHEEAWWKEAGLAGVQVLTATIRDTASSNLQIANAVYVLGRLRPQHYDREPIYAAMAEVIDRVDSKSASHIAHYLLFDLGWHPSSVPDREEVVNLIKRALRRCEESTRSVLSGTLSRLVDSQGR